MVLKLLYNLNQIFWVKIFLKYQKCQLLIIFLKEPKKGYPLIKKLKKALVQKLVEINGVQRISSFLEILNELATTEDYTLLNADGYSFETLPQDSKK